MIIRACLSWGCEINVGSQKATEHTPLTKYPINILETNMFLIALLVLALLTYMFFSTYKSKKQSSKKSQSFLPPIPKDHQIYSSVLVAGVSFRKNDALQFINGADQTLELERETDNSQDKNAIKVIGVTSISRYFLGYVPKEISEQIVKTGMFDKIKPRLARTYQGNDDYIEIQFQIIGLKATKRDFDSLINNQPADIYQKDFFKFFELAIPSGLTKGQATALIKEHTKKLKNEDALLLQEYDNYAEILEEFNDSDFREIYGIKKPSRTILNHVLSQLKQEGKTYNYLASNIQIVVDKVINIKPELKRTN